MAGADRDAEAIVNYLAQLEQQPYQFDFLDLLRRIERTLARSGETLWQGDGAAAQAPARPRIGDSAARRDETIVVAGIEYVVALGQQPHLDFPASNVAEVEIDRESTRRKIRILTKFLGLLGPQGALPLPISEEAVGYHLARDEAFPRFLDLFNQRFLQLFFRSWADARPIVQNDRPDCDRFSNYVSSVIGIGSQAFANGPAIPEGIGLYAGLLGAQSKSASRLRFAIRGLFGVEAEIDQFVGTWLEFDESERSFLGSRNSGLGTDLLVGRSSYSVQDKIRIRIFVRDMPQYGQFLPPGAASKKLVDLVFFYIGEELEWDVELALPARFVEPVQLGKTGSLGWTSWMAPNFAPDDYRRDARFNPAEQAARRRQRPT
jgi:type VI secretion system protein ImpH